MNSYLDLKRVLRRELQTRRRTATRELNGYTELVLQTTLRPKTTPIVIGLRRLLRRRACPAGQ